MFLEGLKNVFLGPWSTSTHPLVTFLYELKVKTSKYQCCQVKMKKSGKNTIKNCAAHSEKECKDTMNELKFDEFVVFARKNA